jgi:hypothetical protein
MRWLSRVLVLVLILPLGAERAAAQMSFALSALDLVDAKVEYQADYRLLSGHQTFHGKLFHMPRRERWEFTNGATPQILLLRRDLDEAAMLWPERRWYMSASFSLVAGLLGGLEKEILHGREAGIEKIGGETAIRYHVDRGSFIGDLWRSHDGILLMARGKVTYNGEPTEGELVLSNLKRVKPDPSLFAKPEGYRGLPFKLGN